ncbi:uncharacterized protein B0H18DRAFT_244 [Fomitopsis serialis]|uniref:uncharacterized protein n=1 Tax=Fomitopsis serialis TaxID=139415 RepID=UPI002007A5F7|nr:uncharacterized protein B0H18DRAFT_244 [Neoantrodia serialis]KAH9937999.1 hypothetical protein B0H18DRAFT_244 [Neoantrodia serialis]
MVNTTHFVLLAVGTMTSLGITDACAVVCDLRPLLAEVFSIPARMDSFQGRWMQGVGARERPSSSASGDITWVT